MNSVDAMPDTALKVCGKCKQPKPSSAFGRHASQRDGLRWNCRDCGRKPARRSECGSCGTGFDHRGPGPLPKLCSECERTLSWCHDCERAKPHRAFRAQAKTRTGRQSRCVECFDVYFARPEVRAARRAAHLRLTYGIDVADFDEMVVEQGGCCGICEEQLSGPIAVDHDHETGSVRGLLCYRCNTGLGSLGDSLDGVMRAAAYLLARVNVLEVV